MNDPTHASIETILEAQAAEARARSRNLAQDIRNAYDNRDRDALERCLAALPRVTPLPVILPERFPPDQAKEPARTTGPTPPSTNRT